MNVIAVKVIRVPGAVVEVGLETGATVQDALDAANITLGSGETVTVDGNTTDTSFALSDGARVILSKQAKSAV